jgi:hypothetical protein
VGIDIWNFLTKVRQGNPNLVKFGQKYRALYLNTQVRFMLCAATYVAQQYKESIVVLPWQRFQYLLC